MLALLSLVLFLSLIFFIILPNYKKNEKMNLPPGPRGLPLIGNLHQFDPLAPHACLSKLAKIYGPILTLKFGRRSTVVIQSAGLAKEVMKTQDHNFCTRPSMVAQQRLSYNGLDLAFTPYGDYHREIKKVSVVHLFSSKRVQSYAPIRREEVSRMIQKISSISSASKPVNLSELLITLSSSIICRVAFGKRYEDEGVEKSKFERLCNETEDMFTAFFFSDYYPVIGGFIDKITGQSSRLERIFKEMDEFYDEIINDHLHPDRPKEDHHEDIVDVLLHLIKERCFSFDLSFNHIKAVLMNIIVAGIDTSAGMVVWAMFELIKNPDIMRKVQQEVRSSAQDKASIDEQDLEKLTYLKAVVKETFRYHPIVPLLIIREAIKKCNLQGYDILPKTLVLVNVWEIGRDAKFWKDSEIFKPERFLESPIDFRGQHFELIPFGGGRRICPGLAFAVANTELALANLLYSFNWEWPSGVTEEEINDIDRLPGIAMHRKIPLCLVADRVS